MKQNETYFFMCTSVITQAELPRKALWRAGRDDPVSMRF